VARPAPAAHLKALARSELCLVGSAPAPRPPNVLFTEYQAAGLDYGPLGASLETLDEAGRVIGVTPPVFAPSDAVRTAPAERRERRSDRRGGRRRGFAGRGFPVAVAAAAGRADHADHRYRVQFGQCKRDPVCDHPFWRRAPQRLPSARLAQWLLIPSFGISQGR
jgi:hypothetical protein